MMDEATNNILKEGKNTGQDVFLVKPFENPPFQNPEFLNHTHNGIDSPRILANNVMNLVGTGQTATFVIGPVSNSDSETYDYVTDGTDDNVQIQAAIDALPTNGGSLCFREGTYTLGATVVVAKNGVTLFGMGKGTIITCKNNLNAALLQLGHASTQYYNCVVQDIYWDGNQINQSSGYVIDNNTLAKPIINTEIINCYFVNLRDAGIINNAAGMLVQGNYFTSWRSGNPAIDVSTGNNATIIGNYFVPANTTAKCINSYDIGVNAFIGGRIIGNTFVLPDSYNTSAVMGAYLVANNYFSIGTSAGSSCKIVHVAKECINNFIVFDSSANASAIGVYNSVNVIGNYIAEAGTGIKTDNVALIIDSNYISAVSSHGINIAADTSSLTITGNFINGASDNTSSAIFINSASSMIVNGNSIRNRHTGTPTDTRYGIFENVVSSFGNIITSNTVLAESGSWQTAAISTQSPLTEVSHNIAN